MTLISPVDAILATASKLRPFPRVAQKVLALLEDPEVSVSRLVEVTELDGLITASVLRAVNSAYHALPQRIDGLKQAITHLGNQPFRELVFASASAAFLAGPQPGYAMKEGDLWRHSVATALMTQVLCEVIKRKPDPALFTAALLHDLGKTVLGSFVQARSQQMLAEAHGGRSFLEAERLLLQLDHAELGARIVEGWNFSSRLAELIRFHHEPEKRPESADLAVLALSNLLCQLYGLGGGVDGLALRAPAEAASRLGLRNHDLEGAMAELHDRLQKAESLLGLAPTARA